MSKRFLLLFGVAIVLALLLTPTIVNAADPVRTDGVRVRVAQPDGYIDFTAEKHFYRDGSRRAELHVVVDLPWMFVNTPLITLQGDPDWVSVSRDLGWGGIDTLVTIYNQRSGQTHTLEIHIDNFATTPYFYEPTSGYYVRVPAEVRGYVLLDGVPWNEFNVPSTDMVMKFGWIFSTRSPGRLVTRLVDVFANQGWVDTGMPIRVGDRVELVANGLWSHGAEGACCGPNPYDANGYRDKYDPGALLPDARVGALVGRIDGGDVFFVGTGGTIVAQQAGRLFLSMNDVPGLFSDNDGLLKVTVQID